MSGIDWTHLVALAIGIVVGALTVYGASEWFKSEHAQSEWDGRATIGGPIELPPRVLRDPEASSPLPAPSTTERLRTWSNDFELIEELPADAKQRQEGWVDLQQGSATERHLRDVLRQGHGFVWLTVDSPRGQWLGHLVTTSWASDRPQRRLVKFRPRRDPLAPEVGWAEWSA